MMRRRNIAAPATAPGSGDSSEFQQQLRRHRRRMGPYMLLLLITMPICFRIGNYLNSPFNFMFFSDDRHPSHLPNCNASALLSLSSSDPGEINRLRRKLALENPSCYEHHFSAFANYTMSRLSSIKKHLSLHIPKSGGTSLCELAELKNETVRDNNCWEKDHFLPLWCDNQFANGDRKEWINEDNNAATCDEIDRLLPKIHHERKLSRLSTLSAQSSVFNFVA